MLSAPKVNPKSNVPRRYWRTCFKFFQLSLSGSETLVQRKVTVVWAYNLYYLETKRSIVLMLWKLSASSLFNFGVLWFLNKYFITGIGSFCVMSSMKVSIAFLMYFYIVIFYFLSLNFMLIPKNSCSFCLVLVIFPNLLSIHLIILSTTFGSLWLILLLSIYQQIVHFFHLLLSWQRTYHMGWVQNLWLIRY